MSIVTQAVHDRLLAAGATVLVVDTSATSLRRSFWARLSRLPRFLRGLARVMVSRPSAIYMSVSGGYGQLYDVAFILVARLKRVPLFLHHHNFGYVDEYHTITHALMRVSGAQAKHIVQSAHMGELLARQYGMQGKAVALSNVGVFCEVPARVKRRRVRTIGFISNVSREKGIFTYLDLMDALKEAGMRMRGRIAGPFQDQNTESKVRARLRNLPDVEYVGAKYGEEKSDFYRSIDVFAFPTMFEAEGLVNHEAMSFGVPVIAFGRGCIPEIVDGSGGLVVSACDDFVHQALTKIAAWVHDEADYRRCSAASREQFERLLGASVEGWESLVRRLAGKDSLVVLPHGG